jgi:protein SCO1/2
MNTLRRVVLAFLLAAPLSAAAAPSLVRPAPLPRDSLYQLPATMTDQSGRRFDWRARRGRPQLVSMFYTTCKFMCPLLVDSGKAVQNKLSSAQRARLGLLFISMDPKRDTPKALAALVASRKLDGNWTLARPAEADVRAIAGVLGVRYRQLADGDFNHTSAWLLLDADGRILARTEKLGGVPDPEFLAAVRQAASGNS